MKVYVVTHETDSEGGSIVGVRMSEIQGKVLAEGAARRPLEWERDQSTGGTRARDTDCQSYEVTPWDLR